MNLASVFIFHISVFKQLALLWMNGDIICTSLPNPGPWLIKIWPALTFKVDSVAERQIPILETYIVTREHEFWNALKTDFSLKVLEWTLQRVMWIFFENRKTLHTMNNIILVSLFELKCSNWSTFRENKFLDSPIWNQTCFMPTLQQYFDIFSII